MGGLIMRMLRLFGLAAFCAGLAACAKPYDTPIFDAGAAQVPAGDPSVRFGGLASTLGTGVENRVLWTHGMCTHKLRWAVDAADAVQATLGAILETRAAAPQLEDDNTWTVAIPTPRGELEATYFIWSPYTKALKDRLLYDNTTGEGAGFPYQRAALNELLKKNLLNDCLADAVIVAGANRKDLYRNARQVLCKFLDGEFREKPDRCAYTGPGNDGVARSLISESLGSKIIADAVNDLQAEPGQEKVHEDRLGTVHQIFLAANQIPLLDLADVGATAPAAGGRVAAPSTSSSLGRMLQRLAQARARSAGKRIQVVAFTDPNDLVSYRLIERYLPTGQANLVNVIVSNDWTYAFLGAGRALELPTTAHCGYRTNRNVLALISVGNPGLDGLTWQDAAARLPDVEPYNCL